MITTAVFNNLMSQVKDGKLEPMDALLLLEISNKKSTLAKLNQLETEIKEEYEDIGKKYSLMKLDLVK